MPGPFSFPVIRLIGQLVGFSKMVGKWWGFYGINILEYKKPSQMLDSQGFMKLGS